MGCFVRLKRRTLNEVALFRFREEGIVSSNCRKTVIAKATVDLASFVGRYRSVSIIHTHRNLIWFEGRPNRVRQLVETAQKRGFQVVTDAFGMIWIRKTDGLCATLGNNDLTPVATLVDVPNLLERLTAVSHLLPHTTHTRQQRREVAV